MPDIYRSQFRMPFKLYEKLKLEADKQGRSVNTELVGRLEKSLTESSNEVDIRVIFEALERLSGRNPDMRYNFGFNLGDPLDQRPAQIHGGKWALKAEPELTLPPPAL